MCVIKYFTEKFNFIFRMKSHGICSPLKSSYNSILLFMIYLIGLIINNSPVKSHPSWDTQTTITGMYLESNKLIRKYDVIKYILSGRFRILYQLFKFILIINTINIIYRIEIN